MRARRRSRERRGVSASRCAWIPLAASLALGLACERGVGAESESSSSSSSSSPLIAAAPETDEVPAVRLEVGEGPAIEAVAVGEGGLVVDRAGVLWQVTNGARVALIDRAHGLPARLPDGRMVIARLEDEPGEADLWIFGGREPEPRAFARAPGADEQPTALPDGRVLFVSGRTGVMSLWVADVKGGAPRQLTNVGLVTGGARDGFVPPPLGPIAIAADGRASWDDGYGQRWSVEVPR